MQDVYRRELERLLRERSDGLKLVRTEDGVYRRLRELFKPGRADTLFGFWHLLSSQGEDVVRGQHARSSFYRKRKDLVESGVSWKGTDAQEWERPSLLDALTLQRDDPYRCLETVEEVREVMRAMAEPRVAA